VSVRGPGAIAALCLRCVVVLAGVNAVVWVILATVLAQRVTGSTLLMPLAYLPYMLLVAAVPVGVVGFPAGLVTARLLARERRERVHVAVFALVGGVLSVALCAWWGILVVTWWPWVIAFAEGVVGAGGARWWTGRAHARRARWSDPSGTVLASARMGA
jgi:hypothetical protein